MTCPARANLVIGAVLVSAALVLSHVTALPLWLFSPLVFCGLILAIESTATMHTYEASARFERWAQAQAKAPQPKPQPVPYGILVERIAEVMSPAELDAWISAHARPEELRPTYVRTNGKGRGQTSRLT